MTNSASGSGDRTGHYFDPVPSVDSSPEQVELTLPDAHFSLTTDAGVFGRKAIDPGTKLLLLAGPDPTPGDHHLADIGAGYGPIALALAARNPDATVWAVEVNERARQLCRANAEQAGLTNVKVVAPEEFDPAVKLDRIWSNPPIRIGKFALHDLLTHWLDRLAPSGTAHLVVQKHLGADSLQRWLTGSGWQAERRTSKSAFRLLDVAARPATERSI